MALAVIIACFFPWVNYNENDMVSGFHSTNTTWGRPGMLHVFFCGLFILMVGIGRVWSIKVAFFVSAFNIAWALRNFLLIPACEAGICPQKHIALYIVFVGSLLTTLSILFVRQRNA
jgi:hypothetical protein